MRGGMKRRVATSPLPLPCGWIRSPAEKNHSFTAVCGAIIRWKHHYQIQCASDLSLLIISKCLGNHLHHLARLSSPRDPTVMCATSGSSEVGTHIGVDLDIVIASRLPSTSALLPLSQRGHTLLPIEDREDRG